MNSISIVQREKALVQRRRNRAILRLRLWSGIKGAISIPWKGILVLLLCVVFIFLWNIRDKLVPFHSDIPLLSTLWGYIIAVFIPLFFMLLLVGLLFLLGTPSKAKEFEGKLLEIGLYSRYGHAPALISCKRIKGTDVSTFTFFSLGVGRERWQKESEAVKDVLDIHYTEPIKYGGKNGRKRDIIVITAAPGAETHREDVLYDDEI
ncbi:hypothetical protein CAFE_27100 [Caprobacter fermentans]|uniref:Uncharacterized protein n=1 Tax=Caproicibacter fermentans TaxID=2576756 RepID=A0A6N8I1J3_9FIRM|nr:hypothetical protein [Caproicibacter fermentans]MVB11981.1 hypothetical protein [Caproicibacter fermentans]